MDLQFMLEEESLQTLCYHYILNQTNKSKTLIINSILMKLVSTPNAKLYDLFQLCYLIIDENKSQNSIKSMTDKQYYRNLSNLTRQVIMKYPRIIQMATEEQIVKIVKFSCAEVFCAVSGNDYISLIALILSKVKQQYSSINEAVELMVLSNKMCVGSYRQITRLHLYVILLKIINKKNAEQLNSDYISRVIRTIQDEKDPRNISCVFQIYHTIINKSNTTTLEKVRKKVFDCLEMYYPIDFEGNSQKHNINLQDIAALLDQCLTNPFFNNEVRGLLIIKMASAPIAKYISTFILTRGHPVTQDAIAFWNNLLLRTGEEEYLQQEYEQNAQYSLSDLIIELLNRIVPGNGPLAYSSYSVILNWMNKFIVMNVFNSEQNSKVAGVIISTIKDIMKKCSMMIKYLLASYIVQQFLRHIKSPGEILYKLGMLVPIFENGSVIFDTEIIGLLVLTLSQIYHQIQEPHPKLIVLKLFMFMSTLQTNAKMINLTNIQHYCIQKLSQDNSDSKIVMAYIDFLVQLYANDITVQTAIFSITKISNKVYGMMVLANKLPNLRPKITELLSNEGQHHQTIFIQFTNVLKMFKPQQTFQTIAYLPQQSEYQIDSICKIVDEKYTNMEISQQNFDELLNKYIINASMGVFTKNIWRPLIYEQNVRKIIKEKIERWIQEQGNSESCSIVAAFYNKTIDAFHLSLSDRIANQTISNTQAYKKQQLKMLPIDHNHIYSSEQCKYWPTIIQYSWRKSKQIRKELIQYLPRSILISQAHQILPIILPDKDIETISKILGSVNKDIVVVQLIPFVIDYLEHVDQNTEVQKIVACNKILFDLENRRKEEEDIHTLLLKHKTRILVALQRNLMHRKRRARQSTRTIFALYNTFK